MKSTDINSKLIKSYLDLMKNLSPASKLDFIEKFPKSLKVDLGKNRKTFSRSFGALETEKSAEELINEIREGRTFDRKIEEF